MGSTIFYIILDIFAEIKDFYTIFKNKDKLGSYLGLFTFSWDFLGFSGEKRL